MEDRVGNWRQHVWDLQEWWSIASDECRREFIDELNLRGRRIDAWFDVDKRFGFDYSNSIDLIGNRCVYAWVTDDGEIVYVGCGDNTRASNFSGRNDAFREKLLEKPMKSFLICYNIHEKFALEIETVCIWRCQLLHHKLINKAKTLSSSEMFAISRGVECEKSAKYEELKSGYPDAVSSLDRLLEYCFNCATKGDRKLDKDPLFNRGRKRKTCIRTAFCINGEIKTVSEWCKKYNRSPSFVMRRIKHGCTPLEALTFPSHPEHKTLELVSYWESIGCCPGADKSSYVVPYDEIPEDILYREVNKRCDR